MSIEVSNFEVSKFIISSLLYEKKIDFNSIVHKILATMIEKNLLYFVLPPFSQIS